MSESLTLLSGSRISEMYTKKAPNKNPTTTGINESSLFFSPLIRSPISSAGTSNDQNEAAVITPDAKPRLPSRKER